jgi:hypothetical protein
LAYKPWLWLASHQLWPDILKAKAPASTDFFPHTVEYVRPRKTLEFVSENVHRSLHSILGSLHVFKLELNLIQHPIKITKLVFWY